MDRPLLTVAIISYGDARALETSLRTLNQQSLSEVDFQVLLLRYDPIKGEKGTSDLLGELVPTAMDKELAEQKSPVTVPQGFGPIIKSTEFITFLREGDFLSPYFLEAMLNAAEENTIPLSQMVTAHSSIRDVRSAPSNVKLLTKGDYALPLPDLPINLLQEPVGKLFQCDLLTEEHMEHIRNEDWLLLQVSIALEREYTFSKFPAAVGATYYRSESSRRIKDAYRFNNSVNYAFQKLQDLQVLRKQELTQLQQSFLSNIEAHFMMTIDRLGESRDGRSTLQTMADLPLRGLPWDVLNEPVDTVAVVTNFAPYAGTAGLVAGKRIVTRGRRVDLISSVVSSRKRYEKDLLLTEPYLRNHKVHSPRIRGDSDVNFRHFLDDALSTFETWQAHGAVYKNIYSRSMMPHSHIVAAAIKRHYPALRWTAEFSDPNSVDAQGRQRVAFLQDPSVLPELQGWGTLEQQRLLLNDLNLYRWAELLPYFHADELLFTNENQKSVMLDSAPVEYRDFIRAKSVVAHHPTLPPGYYRLAEPDVISTEGEILLGYFGNFYDTRGLTEIIEALNKLDDDELRRFKLVIYTGSREERIHSGFPKRVRQIMDIKPRLDFLTSLATMNRMDYLIVNDADTSEYFPLNPFLPSKVSDYLGSNAQVWAIVEAGSVLSKFNFRLRSALGDTDGALRVLREMLACQSGS